MSRKTPLADAVTNRPVSSNADVPPSAVDLSRPPLPDTSAPLREATCEGEPLPSPGGERPDTDGRERLLGHLKAPAIDREVLAAAGGGAGRHVGEVAVASPLVLLRSRKHAQQVERGSLIIVSRQPGLRRGGIAHPGMHVYPAGRFTAVQLAEMIAEPLLEVIEVR